MTRRLTGRLRHRSDGSSRLRPLGGPLTARQWEVIDLLKRRVSTDQLADALVVSQETVRPHIKNILTELDVHTGGRRRRGRRAA